MDKKYKILLLLLLGLVILYLIWRIFLRRNNPKEKLPLGDVFFGIEKYETPKEYQILHNLAKNITPEPLDLGIKEYKREPVPKKLYRTWCTSDPEGICGGRKADIDALNSTQKSIPDWEQIIYGDKEIDNFLEKEFGKDHKVTKAYNLINPKYGAAKADLFRYLIIYKYGGLYLDMKSCVSGPIPEMPKDKDMWISGWNSQGANQHLFPEVGEYQSWYIYARKGCPLLKEIIERVVHNIYTLHENPYVNINISETIFGNKYVSETKAKGNVLCTTGPIAMTIAILNSNQINSVQDDTSINYVLDYFCIKDDWTATKDHYSQQTEPLIFPKKDTNHIPKVVYMTYHDIDSVPQYVFDNINKYCSGYEVKIYNDNMCLEFLEKYYGKEAVEIFNNMEIGAHKADFWRYCILYVFGGYYFDIKTDFQTHINNIFDSKKEKTWYTVKAGDAIFNGIIITPPHNPVILDAIKHIYNNPKPTEYHTYVRELLNIVTKYCKNKVKIGENEQKNNWQCILLQENCDSNCDSNCDRYGLDCIIVDKDGKKLFNTRYKDFGYWGKQKVENYIQSKKTKDLKTIQEKYNYNIIKNGYIPNIIWQTFYKTKVNEQVFELTNNTMLLNPEFNYKIITDLDIVQIIKDNFSHDILNAFLKLNIGAAKGDFTRYILMYLYGGVYLDLDSSISKPISDFIFEHKEYDNILFIDTHYNFEQWILIAKPRNILFKYMIDEMVRRIINNVDNIFLVTGPTLFNDVIYYMTTGNNIFDSNTKVNLTNRKKIFLQDNLLSNHGLKVKVITDAPKYGFNFQPEIEGGIYDDSNIKKYIPTWGTKTPNLYKNNTREDYSPVHITIIVTYISDNIISNKRLSALKNNINKYQNITLNVIGKKKEILKTLIEKQRASNENVIDMLNKALITNCEYIIITEDDFYPIDNFYNELIHTVRLLPKNWRTLHLCPGKLWGRSFGEPDEPGKLRWECGTEPNIPYHKSKKFYINGEDNLFLQHEAWLGGPMCFLIQQKNIPNFMEEYKTHNFDDACDVILTKMLSSNDFICRDPLLGYEKTQGLSVFDENVKDIKEDYSPGNIYGKLPNCFITEHVEEGERIVADNYTNPNACVLEFGGGSGAVSTIIQSKLNNPSNHVVIQPIDSENKSEKPMFGGITSLEKIGNHVIVNII